MKKAQKNPPVNTDITAPTKSTDDKHPAGILNALVPPGGLVLFHISGLWIDGGGPAKITTLFFNLPLAILASSHRQH